MRGYAGASWRRMAGDLPGCSVSASFSNCARVITVLQASPCWLASAQKPFSVITPSSGPTFISGALSVAAGALCSVFVPVAGDGAAGGGGGGGGVAVGQRGGERKTKGQGQHEKEDPPGENERKVIDHWPPRARRSPGRA